MGSSVAWGEGGRVGLEPPHWPEKYAKSHVFSAFEADFCSRNENSPPPKEIFWKVETTVSNLEPNFHCS